MILSDLMKKVVVDSDGERLGRLVDVRFVVDGTPREVDASREESAGAAQQRSGEQRRLSDARLYGFIVSRKGRMSFLGYERNDMTRPWPIGYLFGRRLKEAFLVRWQDVSTIDDKNVRLRPDFERLPPEIPSRNSND